MPPLAPGAAAAPLVEEAVPLFRGCVVLFLGDGVAVRGVRARVLAGVIQRNGGESVALPAAGVAAAMVTRATHVLSGATAAEAAAAALAAAFPPGLAPLSLPLLSPEWVSSCAEKRQLLPLTVRRSRVLSCCLACAERLR